MSAYPRARIDALTDGIYAVAMTLLVLDIRIPESVRPADNAQLLTALAELQSSLLCYFISFAVLGVRWLSLVSARGQTEQVSSGYARWWLGHLFLVTAVPFTTFLVARFASLPLAVWLYAGNSALLALVSLAMLRHERPDAAAELRGRRLSLYALLAASAAVAAATPFWHGNALWLFALSGLVPALGRRLART